MPINIVKIYYNLMLVLYIKGLVFKAVIVISIISAAVSKWLKALLASSMLVKLALLGVRSLKVIR